MTLWDFHSGTKNPVVSKKKVFVTWNLKDWSPILENQSFLSRQFCDSLSVHVHDAKNAVQDRPPLPCRTSNLWVFMSMTQKMTYKTVQHSLAGPPTSNLGTQKDRQYMYHKCYITRWHSYGWYTWSMTGITHLSLTVVHKKNRVPSPHTDTVPRCRPWSSVPRCGYDLRSRSSKVYTSPKIPKQDIFFLWKVYYESRKRELKIRLMN